MMRPDCVLIGASAGGVTALQNLLINLPEKWSIPIVVVQHLPARTVVKLDQVYLVPKTLRVLEADDKMPMEPRHIYMAAPDYHLLIESDRTFSLSQDDPVLFSRPSIDVCFSSAAENLGSSVLAILLTGANSDGANGLALISRNGGSTIVQDPNEAEFNTMPASALKIFQPDYIFKLSEISQFLNSFVVEQKPQQTQRSEYVKD